MSSSNYGGGGLFQPTYRDKKTGETRTSPVWWIFFNQAGRQMHLSAKTKSKGDAHKFLRAKLAEIQQGRPVGPQVERTSFETLHELIVADYKINGRKSLTSLLHHLKPLSREFSGQKAAVITGDRIKAYTAKRLEQGAKPATINRELAALRRAFKLAQEAAVVAQVPVIKLLAEHNTREGFIEREDFEKLLAALPEWLKDPVAFLFYSGWRKGEMQKLEWREVSGDLKIIRLTAAKTKNGVIRVLPLTGELLEIIRRARGKRRLDCTFVFHHDGRPLKDFRTGFSNALRRAGLSTRLLVHDFRRTAVRNLSRALVPDRIAMALTGHKTRSVFDRYNIVSESDLTAALEQRDQYLDNQNAGRQRS